MESCTEQNKRQVPLIKVVRASIIDVHGNITELQEKYSHWAARGFRLLNDELLKVGKTKVLLRVNKNTRTATLPPDFGQALFVGHILNDRKVSMKSSSTLADVCNIKEVPYEDQCTSCGQDKSICEDLAVTEDIELVVINGSTYENVTIKKLYPNGDYYLEKTKWYQDIDNVTAVQGPPEKTFISNFGLKPCGCLENTVENISKLKTNCFDCYSCHYTSCCDERSSYEYAIHEDTGLIQVELNYPYDFIYLEYLGFMQKRNGQYMVPEVAFETLVEWTKWRAIKDKPGAERWRINDAYNYYIVAKKQMLRLLARTSLSKILSIVRGIPKFELEYNNSWYSCFDRNATARLLTGESGGSSVSSGSGSSSSSGGDTIINNNTTTIINNSSYKLAVKTGNGVGHPVNDTSSYQNNLLKNATDIEFVIVAKQIFSKIDGDFAHDAGTGTINLLNGNKFFDGDSLIIPYNKTT